MNILRRLPLSRLLLLCGLVVAIGISITALALGVGGGPTPPPKPLADAVHDALTATPVQGVSARVQLTNHLVEGADLAGGGTGGLASSPLLSGGSGRLWIAKDGRARLELQSEGGDTQVLYDGHTVSLYDPSSNTLYRYTPPQDPAGSSSTAQGTTGEEAAGTSGGSTAADGGHAIPSVAKIQEGISHLGDHADLSGATPTDVAGQPAYTVRISPREDGGLIAGAELSWDATTGVPLRAAVYSTASSSPAIELAASEISYGPVDGSTFDFSPPAGTKIEDVTLPAQHGSSSSGSGSDTTKPKITTHGEGLAAVRVLESPVKAGEQSSSTQAQTEGLPKVDVNGASATELPTSLGTLLSFERAGVRYLLVGSVRPSAIEAFARGL